jgi:hypothetical protein
LPCFHLLSHAALTLQSVICFRARRTRAGIKRL